MRALRWILVLVWMVFLAYFSLGREYPPAIEGALRVTGTTILHFGGYAVLAGLLGWAMGGRGRTVLAALALTSVYGGAIEALQLVVPGRRADWADLGVNLAGTLVGTLILVLAIRAPRWTRPNQEN